MGALSIVFDITIVGALTRSCVVLTVDLFFLESNRATSQRSAEIGRTGYSVIQPAVLGVLLFEINWLEVVTARLRRDDCVGSDTGVVGFHRATLPGGTRPVQLLEVAAV